MKRITLALLVCFTLGVLFTSCNQSDFKQSENAIPDSYSSEEAEHTEDNRKVVKTASISMEVDHLEESILSLKSFLKPISGYVYNYEINNSRYQTDSYQKNMDSSVTVEQVRPAGNLSVRVPIIHADSFINYVLKADAHISSLKISDDDITENLWEKKQLANVYSNSSKAQKRKGSSTNISYDNSNAVQAIKAKALASKMNYKTQYLWFDIAMSAKPFYKSTTTIAAKNYRTPIHIAVANAMVKGWHICSDIIIALISIWPIMILVGLILFFLRKYRLRTS